MVKVMCTALGVLAEVVMRAVVSALGVVAILAAVGEFLVLCLLVAGWVNS